MEMRDSDIKPKQHKVGRKEYSAIKPIKINRSYNLMKMPALKPIKAKHEEYASASKDSAIEPTKDIAKEPTKDIAKKPVKDVAKVPVKDIVKQPVKDISNEPVKDVAKALVKDITKEPVKSRSSRISKNASGPPLLTKLDSAGRKTLNSIRRLAFEQLDDAGPPRLLPVPMAPKTRMRTRKPTTSPQSCKTPRDTEVNMKVKSKGGKTPRKHAEPHVIGRTLRSTPTHSRNKSAPISLETIGSASTDQVSSLRGAKKAILANQPVIRLQRIRLPKRDQSEKDKISPRKSQMSNGIESKHVAKLADDLGDKAREMESNRTQYGDAAKENRVTRLTKKSNAPVNSEDNGQQGPDKIETSVGENIEVKLAKKDDTSDDKSDAINTCDAVENIQNASTKDGATDDLLFTKAASGDNNDNAITSGDRDAIDGAKNTGTTNWFKDSITTSDSDDTNGANNAAILKDSIENHHNVQDVSDATDDKIHIKNEVEEVNETTSELMQYAVEPIKDEVSEAKTVTLEPTEKCDNQREDTETIDTRHNDAKFKPKLSAPYSVNIANDSVVVDVKVSTNECENMSTDPLENDNANADQNEPVEIAQEKQDFGDPKSVKKEGQTSLSEELSPIRTPPKSTKKKKVPTATLR